MAKSERVEILMRIVVGIISGIILELWKIVVIVVSAVNWIITLFTAKRNKDLAEFCEIWNTQRYKYYRYMTMVSNERVFPFAPLGKNLSKFEKRG